MLEPRHVAHCHSCMNAHADWETGDTWQCLRCLFRIPFAHVWWWCIVQKSEEKRTIVQMEMF